jgi:hypothetical protein
MTAKGNDFKDYVNSGGTSRKEEMTAHINSIQAKIARAQQVKGTLTLNNAKPLGGNWKTPELDLKLRATHGG